MSLWNQNSDEMNDRIELPPAVYVPCLIDDRKQVRLLMRENQSGQRLLLVYTAFDRFRDLAGDKTSWVLINTEAISEVLESEGIDLVVADMCIPEEYR